MESSAYEQTIFEDQEMPVAYAGFWHRFLALFIDGLVLIPFTLLNSYSQSTLQSRVLAIACMLVLMLYKPVLEYRFGATLGKMAVNIKVVNNVFGAPNAKNIILRNIVSLAFSLANFFVTLFAMLSLQANQPSVITDQAKSLDIFTVFNSIPTAALISGILSLCIFLFYVADTIVLLADSATKRSLHDRIGSTYVVFK